MQQLQLWPDEPEVKNREKIWQQIDYDSQTQLLERLAQIICKTIQHPRKQSQKQEKNYESQ